MRNNINENKITFFVVTFVIFILIIFAIYSRNINKKIEKEGYVLVSKFIGVKKFVKSKSFYFEFYFKGNKKINEYTNLPKEFEKNIGKFYFIKYLPEYPNSIIILYEKEITNKKLILKSGFKETDLYLLSKEF